MDNRLIVTVAFAVHAVGGGLLAIAKTVTSVQFTDGQLEFLILVGYLGPVLAMALIWLKNYVYGAPLLVGSTFAGGWFALYFFFVNANPANVAAVTGGGATAYLSSAVAVVIGSFVAGCAGLWLWYCEVQGFRTRVDRVVRPPDSSD